MSRLFRYRPLVALAAGLLALSGCGPSVPRPGPGPTRAPPQRSEAPLVGALINRPIDSGTRAAVLGEGGDIFRCMAEMTAARVSFRPMPDRINGETCSLTDGGVLGADMGTVASLAPASPTMTCQTALAVSIWRRQSVEPAAREILGSDVVQIDHMGTYACRSVNNGGVSNRASAHSRAAALDFSGVRLRDGRRISVRDGWHGDTPEARFLKRIRDDACRVFGTVLSPDYNAVHHDHLHLEATDTRFCR
jgi:hypothetical protein